MPPDDKFKNHEDRDIYEYLRDRGEYDEYDEYIDYVPQKKDSFFKRIVLWIFRY